MYQNSLHPSSKRVVQNLFNILTYHNSGVTFLKITSDSLNIPQSSYDSFIKALSKVVGSSFRHNFDYLSPFPLFEFRDSSGSFNGMLRLFPREQANADSYNSWQYLFPEVRLDFLFLYYLRIFSAEKAWPYKALDAFMFMVFVSVSR